jgi:TetR/AcrR family transcriptional regulator, cholesterol catabolism regulator
MHTRRKITSRGVEMPENLRETGARERILKAALKIFSQQGYHGASMQEISTEANANKASLFYYFSSKENLYQEVIKDIHRSFSERILREQEGITDFGQRFRQMILSYVHSFSESKNVVLIMLREVLGIGPGLPVPFEEIVKTMKQPMIDILTEGVREKYFLGIDPNFTATAILGMMQIFFRMPVTNVSQYDDETVYENIMEILSNGILNRSQI